MIHTSLQTSDFTPLSLTSLALDEGGSSVNGNGCGLMTSYFVMDVVVNSKVAYMLWQYKI